MRKNDVSLLIALLALTISGCTSSPKKKSKKPSSNVETSSILSNSKEGTSARSSVSSGEDASSQSPISSVAPSSEVISSASIGASSSASPISSGYPSSSVPVLSSAQPVVSSTTPIVSSSDSVLSSNTPVVSSSVIPVSSGTPHTSTSISPIIGDTDYTDCQTEYDHGNASGLLSELRNVTKNGESGSYNDLWNTYNTAYVVNGKMYDYYSNITNYTPGDDQDHGSHSDEGDTYNREHSIPKSWWGGSTSTGSQGCDPFIVVPTDSVINGIRNNYTFGIVESVTNSSANGYSKLGYGSNSWGYSGIVFEPNDSVKGDFARIYFYAIAKYTESYD